MAMNKLAAAFQKRIATQTVLIRRLYHDEQGVLQECQGTGVIIGHEEISIYRGVHIMTAGHVLDGFGEGTSTWIVSRIERDEEHVCVERVQTFRDVGTWSSFPRFMASRYLRDCDIGLMAIENKTDEPNQLFIDPAIHPRLKVAPRTGYLQTGARVAWAGFPSFVSDLTGTYDLCYFEGTVAAAPLTKPIFLVDGHTAPGVSGGPLWILQEDGEPIIIGVCINYISPQADFPGLAGFCPMGVLLDELDRFYGRSVTEPDSSDGSQADPVAQDAVDGGAA